MLSPTTVSNGATHHRSVRNVRALILARCPCPVSVLVLIAVPRSLGECASGPLGTAGVGGCWCASLSPRPEGRTPARA
jgi:hypothetical protein